MACFTALSTLHLSLAEVLDLLRVHRTRLWRLGDWLEEVVADCAVELSILCTIDFLNVDDVQELAVWIFGLAVC